MDQHRWGNRKKRRAFPDSGVVAPRYDFLPDLEKIVVGGLVAQQKTKVIQYRHERPESE